MRLLSWPAASCVLINTDCHAAKKENMWEHHQRSSLSLISPDSNTQLEFRDNSFCVEMRYKPCCIICLSHYHRINADLCRNCGVMTGFSDCWRSGPMCSTNLWRQRKQKHKWIARRLNTAFILFNMSHRQCPWCARSPPHVSGSQVKGMMDTAPRRRDDTQLHLTCFHMRAAVSGGGGRAWQVFILTFSPVTVYFYAAHHSATDLTLDKWRWRERNNLF